MRAWNDALNPEEQIATLMGKKLGDGVPGILGIGEGDILKVEIYKQ